MEKQIDKTDRRTLVELCLAGYKKYDQSMRIDIGTENGSIQLHYCAIPEFNGCKYKTQMPLTVDGKEYYFCRRTK